jgi:hypothetical protein
VIEKVGAIFLINLRTGWTPLPHGRGSEGGSPWEDNFVVCTRRATVAIGDQLQAELDSWLRQQDAQPSLTTVVQAALKEFLALHGLGTLPRKLHITPSKTGSGSPDGSIAHDLFLAGE